VGASILWEKELLTSKGNPLTCGKRLIVIAARPMNTGLRATAVLFSSLWFRSFDWVVALESFPGGRQFEIPEDRGRFFTFRERKACCTPLNILKHLIWPGDGGRSPRSRQLS
jgi:hypothetical protein